VSEWILPAIFGFGAGILAAWGVGGGTLLLLGMTLFLEVEGRTAGAINLLFFLPTAALSLLGHGRRGYLDAAVWRAAAPWATLCAAAGAFAAQHLDTQLLRRPFGLFLLWAGVSLLRKTWRERKRKQ